MVCATKLPRPGTVSIHSYAVNPASSTRTALRNGGSAVPRPTSMTGSQGLRGIIFVLIKVGVGLGLLACARDLSGQVDRRETDEAGSPAFSH